MSSCEMMLPKEEAHSQKENSTDLTDMPEEKPALIQADSLLEDHELGHKVAKFETL